MNTKIKILSERGQSMVELAITLTFLLWLVAGIVDLGRALITYLSLREAAQEGAAYASIVRVDSSDPMACTDIIDRVRGTSTAPVDFSNTVSILVDVEINGTPCASAPLATACLGSGVQVTVTYNNYPLVTPFIGTILGHQSINLSASAIDTILTPACQ
jgi:Flp pilus assembly protein TadG